MIPDAASLRLGFAFGLGTVTFFAPCAAPLLPGYVAYFVGRDDDRRPVAGRVWHGLTVGLLVSAGFFFVYAALAGVAVAVGTRALGNVAILELVVGLALVALGVGTVTGRFNPSRHVPLPERRKSPVGYVLFGVVYAVAAAGCTAPTFVAVALLGIESGPLGAVALFGAYAAGMSVLMVGVTVATALGRGALVGRLSPDSRRLTVVAGLVLVVAGVIQVYFYLFRFGGLARLPL